MADLGIFLRRKKPSSTDTSYYIHVLREVCRSVFIGPPCLELCIIMHVQSQPPTTIGSGSEEIFIEQPS